MVRGGWKELPPAGFQYVERGVAPFVVAFVYGLVLFASLIVLGLFTVLLATSGRDHAVLAVGLGLLIFVLAVTCWLISLYLFAALLTAPDRLGIAKALDPRRLFAVGLANHDVSLRVAFIYAVTTLAVTGIIFPVAIFIPFGGLLVLLVLPAVYAILVPSLAGFQVEPEPRPASA